MKTHPLQGLHWSARFSAAQRQALALLPALLAGALAWRGLGAALNTALLCGWVVYCAAHLSVIGHLAWRLDAEDTRRRAGWEDPGAAMMFVLVTLAACASLVSVGLGMQASGGLGSGQRVAHMLLMALSLAGAWLLIQGLFALHYARRYYRPERDSRALARGLDFPGGQAPDYLDFLYFSAVIGMTSQVSDVTVRTRAMRRMVLLHSLLSFAFNLVVLALAVNALASALAH